MQCCCVLFVVALIEAVVVLQIMSYPSNAERHPAVFYFVGGAAMILLMPIIMGRIMAMMRHIGPGQW